jgi:chromate transporter
LNHLGKLFAVFFKIGLFTFGGGYAMIPMIQREIVEKKKWITEEDVLEIVVIAESTPGPVAINSATFVGYHVGGFWGALMATFGVVLPSFVIITLIARVLEEFQSMRLVKYAFWGIRAGVLALILKAFCSIYRKCPKTMIAYVTAALAFLFAAIFKTDLKLVIVGCALLGLVSSRIAERRMTV